jgi:hypothetical protein
MKHQKIIKIKISLDTSFVTERGKVDITDDVFEELADATEQAIKESVNIDDDDFANSILENYNQPHPQNFKSFKNVGFKVEVI